MRVYIDITRFKEIEFMSGIQRVVSELGKRFLASDQFETLFLAHDQGQSRYQVAQPAIIGGDLKVTVPEEGGTSYSIHDMQPGDILFDVDAVWQSYPRRAILYPRLKERGVKIVPFIHDILPITDPQFFGVEGDWSFLGYLGACINYADCICVTTHATQKVVQEMIRRIGADDVPMFVTKLGSNLKPGQGKSAEHEQEVDPATLQFVSRHPDYVLMVGTIEPRKNHKVILDAFEQALFQRNIPLVFAGRIGWKNEEMLSRITRDSIVEKNFAFLKGKDTAAINYLYQNAKLVVFPSFNEGYGLPIIEALNYGVPVVAGDVPVLREVGGDTCLYCDVNDYRPWIQTIGKLYADGHFYQVQKQKALRFVPPTWDEVADRITGLFLTL